MQSAYSIKIKSILDDIIHEMSLHPEDFAKDPSKDFTRKRKLPFEELIKLLLCMRGNSLNKEIYDFYKDENDIISTSAFIQQRDKLLPEAMEYLLKEFNNRCEDKNTYNGYYLYAVDGSGVNIATNKESESYVYNGKSEGYSQLHLNAMYDVLNKVYIDCIIQPRTQNHERKAAINMINNYNFNKPTILVADRGYPSYNLMEHVNRTPNLDYVFRVKNEGYADIQALPMKELDTTISCELRSSETRANKELFKKGLARKVKGGTQKAKNWDFEEICQMTYRVVRFKITEDTYETIVTSLDRFKFPLKKIKEIYHLRWGIETSFRELKYAIGLVSFHAKKEEYIKQEIFARLVMYNFCERITMAVVVKQRDRKYTYQANFTMGIHICIDFFRSKKSINVEDLISKYILPVREGRADKRKLKPKTVVYFLYRVA